MRPVFKYILFIAMYLVLVVLVLQWITPGEIKGFIASFGLFSPIVYIALYIARGFVRFPGYIFLALAPLIFPLYLAIMIHLIAMLLSATSSFFIGKKIRNSPTLLPTLKRRIENKSFISKKLEKYGFAGIATLQVTGFSFDLPNYLAGYLQFDYKKFILTVFAANLSSTLMYNFVFSGVYAALFTIL